MHYNPIEWITAGYPGLPYLIQRSELRWLLTYSAAVLGYHGWQESYHSAQLLHKTVYLKNVATAETVRDPTIHAHTKISVAD